MTDRTQMRDRLVLAALPHVVFDGWSVTALKAAARDCGLEDGMAEVAFMGGPVEAVEHLADLADRKMGEELAGMDLASLKIRERTACAVKVRLTQWEHEREAMRRALQLFALPMNAPRAIKVTARTVDAMWKAIGDRSADFSWYTKRFSLGAVYVATVLYWLDDGSEGYVDTWEFLDRRIQNVLDGIKARQKITEDIVGCFKPLGV